MRLIDADVLKEDLTRFYDGEVVARRLIDEQPTVDAVPVRHGHWVDHNDDDDDDDWGMWECSECHVHLMSMAVNLNGVYRFCPKCGARMDGKDGDND